MELKCCCAACADQYERTITVKLYALQNADGLIGSVMYGHVANPQVVHNMMYNLTSSSRDLGSVPKALVAVGRLRASQVRTATWNNREGYLERLAVV